MKTDKQKNIRLIYRREYLAIRPCIDLCAFSIFIVLWRTATKPGCDELTLSCFLLSCQLSSQTTWTPPVTERGGNLWLHADRGHRNLLPSFLCTNPFKGEPLCDQTAGIAAELEASNTTALVLKLSQVHVKHCLPDLWHPQTACTFDFIRLTAFEQLRRKYDALYLTLAEGRKDCIQASRCSASSIEFLHQCIFWRASDDAERIWQLFSSVWKFDCRRWWRSTQVTDCKRGDMKEWGDRSLGVNGLINWTYQSTHAVKWPRMVWRGRGSSSPLHQSGNQPRPMEDGSSQTGK